MALLIIIHCRSAVRFSTEGFYSGSATCPAWESLAVTIRAAFYLFNESRCVILTEVQYIAFLDTSLKWLNWGVLKDKIKSTTSPSSSSSMTAEIFISAMTWSSLISCVCLNPKFCNQLIIYQADLIYSRFLPSTLKQGVRTLNPSSLEVPQWISSTIQEMSEHHPSVNISSHPQRTAV